MTRSNLDNPILLFLILIISVSINTISTIHFLLIMFAGILFTAFHRFLRKRYLYSLTFVIIAFLFIEVNSGLKPFSLTLLSLFIYVFILPKVENSNSVNGFFYIIIFYIGLTILWAVWMNIDSQILLALFLNLIIDLLFFGVFL